MQIHYPTLALLCAIISMGGCNTDNVPEFAAASGENTSDPETTPDIDSDTDISPGPAVGPSDTTPDYSMDEVACDSDPAVFRQAILDLNNADRASGQTCGDVVIDPVGPLVWSDQLEVAARRHTQDMATHDLLSHTGTDGSRVSDRVSDAGFQWRAVGENVASGYHALLSVQAGWLESPGHCENIMNLMYTHMAAACITDPERPDKPFWTVVFATPF